MNVDRIIDEQRKENDELEYKHPEENSEDFAKELAAFANSGGGRIIVGVVEQNGEISDLVSVDNPQQLEERIHQAIATRLIPRLQFSTTEHTYQGGKESWHDTTLITLTRDASDRLHGYKHENFHVIPVRQGSTTRYATGQEIADFYERGIRPGRADEITEDSVTDSTSLADALGAVAQGIIADSESQGEEPNTEANDEAETSEEIAFDHTEPAYYFTPTGTGDAVTFHLMMAPYQPHGFEGISQFVTRGEVANILAALQRYFNANLSQGQFTIAQSNGAWFGTGAGNFLKALAQDERYETVPIDYDLSRHHSEGAIFIADLNHKQNGQVILRARDGLRSEMVEQFSVSFLTEGIPIDNREMNAFLDETELSLYNGESIPMQTASLHATPEEIPLTIVDRVPSWIEEGWVGGIVCENPFHDDPKLLQDQISSENWDYFEPLITYEHVYCRLSDHHPMSEQRDYYLRQSHLQSLTQVQGTTPHLNASLSANW